MPFTIEQNVNLEPYNTFKVKANARYLARLKTLNDLVEVRKTDLFRDSRRFILGGGSNILLIHDFDGLILKSELKGIAIEREDQNEVLIKVASGENWHEVVLYCLGKNWGGIENLSLIPGTVGAAPIQNIGAYGVEIKDVIENVEGVKLDTGDQVTLTKDECTFSYRESIFKHDLREKIFISSVTLRLRKKNHLINYDYGNLRDHLLLRNNSTPTIHDVSNAVIEIRQKKLPDPNLIGNAGSFFKNPVVNTAQLENLKSHWSNIPFYPFENQNFKIPAGWLIEMCGWKGKRIGNVGVHKHQSLVIVNHDHASGDEIYSLSEKICNDVQEKFGITLTREVNMIS